MDASGYHYSPAAVPPRKEAQRLNGLADLKVMRNGQICALCHELNPDSANFQSVLIRLRSGRVRNWCPFSGRDVRFFPSVELPDIFWIPLSLLSGEHRT